MQSTVLEALALTVAGNAAIKGRDTSGFWPGAEVFRFVKYCRFVSQNGKVLASDPNEWIEQSRRQCFGLRLHVVDRHAELNKDRETVGFVGGGPHWILDSVEPNGTSHWEGRLTVLDKNDPERKIWQSTDVQLHGKISIPPERTIPLVSGDLEAALTNLASFADEKNLKSFGKAFRTAICFLNGERGLEKQKVYEEIVQVAEFSQSAANLFYAVAGSWVFGAMGSWNDLSFEITESIRYRELSSALFNLLKEGVVAVGNSTFPSR